jgi:hypothetical protein
MAHIEITRFTNLNDLARLPWFSVEDGRLVVADPTVGPAIDMHTHLALAYVRKNTLDLHKRTAKTEHYLPNERPIDLDVYINQNMTPEDLSKLSRDLTLGSVRSSGMRATHTIGNLVREMHELGITQSVLLPIDFPEPLSHNAKTWMHASKDTPEMVCFGSVHPFNRNLEKRVDEQVRLGARGIKVHPAVQLVSPENSRAMQLYKLCGARNLPVLFHCGPVGIEARISRSLSQVRLYEKALAETPETTFVLGHSGAMQLDEGIAFARRYPNVYLELSSQSLTGVRKILDQVSPDRIVFGTDWPFYHQAIGLAKVLLATQDHPEARHKILRENAERLLAMAPRKAA